MAYSIFVHFLCDLLRQFDHHDESGIPRPNEVRAEHVGTLSNDKQKSFADAGRLIDDFTVTRIDA
jgi:hypothetical protein